METVLLAIILISVVIGIVLAVNKILLKSKIENSLKLINDGKYALAEKELKTFIDKNHESVYAHFLLAECYFKQDNYEWALPEYNIVLKMNKYTEAYSEYDVRSRLANIFLHYKKSDEAQKEFILMSKIQPGNYHNYYEIGKIFQERNYTENAYSYFKKALSINPQHVDSLFKAGEISYQQNRFEDAILELQAALKENPDYHKAHFYLGRIHFDNKSFVDAAQEFEEASRDTEFRVKALAYKGRSLFEMTDYENAILVLERAKMLANEDLNINLFVKYYLSLTYEKARRLDDAIVLWESIMKMRSDYMDVAEKLDSYADLRLNDRLKDYMTVDDNKFESICRAAIGALGLSVMELYKKSSDNIEILAMETDRKLINQKPKKVLVHFIRDNENIPESFVREFHNSIRNFNAMKGTIYTSSGYSSASTDYASTRPIELIDKNGLSNLLEQLNRSEF